MVNNKKEDLEYLYNEKKLTAFEISQILNIPQGEVINLLQKLEIDSNPTRKKYRLINKIPLSSEQKQFIVGVLLGAGTLNKYKDNFELCIKGSKEDKTKLLWYKIILGNYVNALVESETQCILRTAKLTELSFYWKLFYQNNKKILREELLDQLTNFGLAVWFSTSGTYYKDSIRFSTFKFSYTEQELLQRVLKVNFGINSKICEYTRNDTKYYFISVNKRNSEILMKIIKPVIDRSSETLCQDIQNG